MKALSIRQPWAWLIAAGIKDVENRSWWTSTRERVYIHAGLKIDQTGYDRLLAQDVPLKDDYRLGAIIGEVDIVDCKFRKPLQIGCSKWHDCGYWGFILANAVLYERSIPCRGQLGFFGVDIDQLTGEAGTEFSWTFRRE